jgi:hypothetical protein
MANWKYTLNVKNEWEATKAGDMTLQAFAAFVVKKLDRLGIKDDEELLGIVDELSDIAQDEEADVEWFDNVWSSLYDWADQSVGQSAVSIWPDKMCWIKTF